MTMPRAHLVDPSVTRWTTASPAASDALTC